MPGKHDEFSGWWYFDSVQELWDAEGLEDKNLWVERDRFMGWLQKGVVEDGFPRALKRGDVEQGRQPDILFILQLRNLDRPHNWDRLPNPPPRTGKLATFMDEVEAVAARGGCWYVWVDKVANGFLGEKLENRGYRRLPNPDGFPNPDYLKLLATRRVSKSDQ